MKLIKRTKLRKYYKEILHCQFTFINAPKGYGKTTFIRQFFEERPDVTYIYIDLNQRYTTIDEFKITDYIVIAGFLYKRDFRIFERLKECQGGNKISHIILISDDKLPDIIYEWHRMGTACIIATRNLAFDDDEIKRLLKVNKFDYNQETIARIQNLCGNWIWAIVLFLSMNFKSPVFKINHGLYVLYEDYIFHHLSTEDKELYMYLSILQFFTYEDMTGLFPGYASYRAITILMETGFLLIYDEKKDVYRFLHAFRLFLQEKLIEYGISIKKINMKIALYYESKCAYIYAVYHYFKAEELEAIAELLNTYEGGMAWYAPDLMRKVYDSLPKELLQRYPYAYLRMIQDYITVIQEPQYGRDLIRDFHTFLLHQVRDVRQLQGELLLCRGTSARYDLTEMLNYFKKGYELLENSGSRLDKTGILLPYGNVQVLLLYHQRAGDLILLTEYIGREVKEYMSQSNHAEAGFELIADAEYFFETGEFHKAQQYALEAYYITCRNCKSSIRVPALCLLGRAAYLNGNVELYKFAISHLQTDVRKEQNVLLERSTECSILYLKSITHESVVIPDWLLDDYRDNRKYYNLYIVLGQALINHHRYLELKILADVLMKILEKFVFGRIYAMLFKTIAVLHLEGIGKAQGYYAELLKICEKDQILGAVFERHAILKPLITAPNQQGYGLKLRQLYESRFHSEIQFTMREHDIMRCIGTGYTTEKTAEILHLKKNTIYSYIKQIYRKLNISRRDDFIDYIKKQIM